MLQDHAAKGRGKDTRIGGGIQLATDRQLSQRAQHRRRQLEQERAQQCPFRPYIPPARSCTAYMHSYHDVQAA